MTVLAVEGASSAVEADAVGDVAAGKAGSTAATKGTRFQGSAKAAKGPSGKAGARGGAGSAGSAGSRGPRGKAGASGGAVAATSGQSQPRQSGGTQRRSSGSTKKKSKGRSKRKLPNLVSSKAAPHVSAIIAEWLIAVLLILWEILSGQRDYLSSISNAMWRLTSISAIFFVLALFMRGKNTGRVAVAFGALIDLALVLQASKKGQFKALSGVFAGEGTGGSSGGVIDTSKTGKGGQPTTPASTAPPTQHYAAPTQIDTGDTNAPSSGKKDTGDKKKKEVKKGVGAGIGGKTG